MVYSSMTSGKARLGFYLSTTNHKTCIKFTHGIMILRHQPPPHNKEKVESGVGTDVDSRRAAGRKKQPSETDHLSGDHNL